MNINISASWVSCVYFKIPVYYIFSVNYSVNNTDTNLNV